MVSGLPDRRTDKWVIQMKICKIVKFGSCVIYCGELSRFMAELIDVIIFCPR